MNTMIAYAVENTTVGGVACDVAITNLTTLINFFTCTIMKAIVPLLVSLAMAGFVYGVIKFFMNPDNEEKRKNGKSFMLWGVVSLFVIVSIWGLVGILSNTFLKGDIPVMPSLPEPIR
ncbi:MAG: hypothetical protein WC908_00795 [Candidatus Paceibacterota bacterium]